MAFNQPNYYGYQQYGQPYMYQPMQPIAQAPPPTLSPSQPQQTQVPMLYGKVVDGIDVVKAMDVPINQAAICPKADLSAVYIKSWNADGTTKVSEYKLYSAEQVSSDNTNLNSVLDEIKSSIINLDKKIDRIRNNNYQQNKKRKTEEAVKND